MVGTRASPTFVVLNPTKQITWQNIHLMSIYITLEAVPFNFFKDGVVTPRLVLVNCHSGALDTSKVMNVRKKTDIYVTESPS